jgi:hypothetical protein
MSSPATTTDAVTSAVAIRSADVAIPRVSASTISPDEFVQRFVLQSKAVIIEGALDAWMSAAAATVTDSSPSSPSAAADSAPAEWSIERLSQLLGGEVMKNVFVSAAANQRRFKFYKQQSSPQPAAETTPASTNEAAAAASSSDCVATSVDSAAAASPSASPTQQVESGLSRLSLPFDEFVKRSTGSDNSSDADAAERPAYYLYGEPMPARLQPLFPTPPIVSRMHWKAEQNGERPHRQVALFSFSLFSAATCPFL